MGGTFGSHGMAPFKQLFVDDSFVFAVIPLNRRILGAANFRPTLVFLALDLAEINSVLQNVMNGVRGKNLADQ